VNAAREPLHGEVEIDDTWIGGTQAGLRGSRQLKGRRAALVLAVEKRGKASGRVRMAVIPDFKATTLNAFIKRNRAIGNLQQWLIGTYHGVSRAQLQVYLDEFVFRHNRRKQPMAAFQTLLGLGTGRAPTAYGLIRGAKDIQ
ncbi:MAG: transposase, partial [Pyrinomonadaceae bacterium]|nr:transposase [Pyrinomonadaceae bacterium]